MPYKTCFIDVSSVASDNFDVVVDSLFAFDILLNFVSAYEKADGTLVYKLKEIAISYIRSWFLLDVLAVFPFDFVFDQVERADKDLLVETQVSSIGQYN